MIQTAVKPEVGMGATYVIGSDRYAGTIVAVERFAIGPRAGLIKEITFQADRAIRVDGNGMSEAQTYRYERNPQGRRDIFRPQSDGRFFLTELDGSTGHRHRQKYGELLIGQRTHYRDFSF